MGYECKVCVRAECFKAYLIDSAGLAALSDMWWEGDWQIFIKTIDKYSCEALTNPWRRKLELKEFIFDRRLTRLFRQPLQPAVKCDINGLKFLCAKFKSNQSWTGKIRSYGWEWGYINAQYDIVKLGLNHLWWEKQIF